MSEKYKTSDPEKAYFVTMTAVHWIDVFTRLKHKMSLIDSLRYCQHNKGLELFAYVIMSNHIHMICRAREGFQLSDIIRDFKKFTSKKIILDMQEEGESRRAWMLEFFEKACDPLKREQNYKLWQDGYHPEIIFSTGFMHQKLDYIHNNPVKAGIVENPEEYLFSSARNYSSRTALLEIISVQPRLITY